MSSSHRTIVLLIFAVALSACSEPAPGDGAGSKDAGGVDRGPEERPLPPLMEVCPRNNGTPVIGDANGDGVTDIADAVALQNHLFRGGPAPACYGAADFDGDRAVEMDDAERVTIRLLTGEQIPRALGARECDSATFWPSGQCAELALDLLAPLRVTEELFRVQVAIRSPTLAVQGYSLSLEAEGCEIQSTTAEGTVAAEVWDDPPGSRHLGWAATTPVEGGAIAYLILSTIDDVYFPTSTDPVAVLSAEVRAERPASGCQTCSVGLRDGLVWRGLPINTMIAANGRAFVPQLRKIEVEVCAE